MQVQTSFGVRLNRKSNQPLKRGHGSFKALLDRLQVEPAAPERGRPPSAARATTAEPEATGTDLEADAERFLSRMRHGTPAELGARGWLRRAGLNVRRASDTWKR